jgi:hypothetical protein
VNRPEQTPFFVTQGTGLEAFAVVTEEMKRLGLARARGAANLTQEDDVADLIAAAVSALDRQFVAPEDASKCMETARSDLIKHGIDDPLVRRFYEKGVVEGGKLATLPWIQSVADFAQTQGWAKKYFVRVIREERPYRVRRGPSIFGLSFQKALQDDDQYITKTRIVPVSLESTQPLPFEVLEVSYEAKKHPSLRSFLVYLSAVCSLTEVTILSAFAHFVPTGWKERKLELSGLKWKSETYLWGHVVAKPAMIWRDVTEQAEATIKSYLQGLLPKKDSGEPESISSTAAAEVTAASSSGINGRK